MAELPAGSEQIQLTTALLKGSSALPCVRTEGMACGRRAGSGAHLEGGR